MSNIEPGLSWEIDLFRPQDAQGVVDLFLTVYGKDYPVRIYTDPDLLIAENAARRNVSSVARNSKGQIIGHCAVFRTAPFEGIWESGGGLIHPAYRGGSHIFTDLVAHGQGLIKTMLQGVGIYGEPVLNHVFSQRMTRTNGWTTFGLEADLMPAAAYEKESSATGRVSVLFDSLTFAPRPHRVHLPPDLEEELGLIYSELNDQRDMVFSEEAPPPAARTQIAAKVHGFAQVARMAVPSVGADLVAALEREEAAAAQGARILQVWLNLGQPSAGWAATELRRRGYFLGGILPRWFDDDGLLLQRMNHRPHWEGMKLAFERGEKIAALVRADWERTQA